jgi:hypothetical protein
MRLLLTICFFLTLTEMSYGQEDRSQEKNVLYTKSSAFGILAHTRGYGLDYQWTRQRSVSNMQLMDLSVFELMHPKEMALPNPLQENSSPYVFGKINNLVALTFNYGTRKILGDRYIPSDIKVSFNYSFGPILGWLKPMYYDVKLLNPDGNQYDIIHAKFDPANIAYQQNTIGNSDFTKGFNESFFMFGGNAKSSLSFEWGAYDYKYYALETGVMVDAFASPVPIFAGIKNDQVFINLYLCFSYGTRK